MHIDSLKKLLVPQQKKAGLTYALLSAAVHQAIKSQNNQAAEQAHKSDKRPGMNLHAADEEANEILNASREEILEALGIFPPAPTTEPEEAKPTGVEH